MFFKNGQVIFTLIIQLKLNYVVSLITSVTHFHTKN